MTHSEQVARKALKIWKEKELALNPHDIYCAALLHDIGVVNCHAPDIHAFGSLPYLRHGLEGEAILKVHGLDQYARVCATHIGAGITSHEILKNNLPLPPKDFLPETLLEKLICYADKFYSKSGDLTKEKPLEDVIKQMNRFGPGSLARFLEMHKMFGEN